MDTKTGSIDILRPEGTQLGLFAIDRGELLTLKLADVNHPRPKDLAMNKHSRTESRYVFKRLGSP